MNIPRNALAAYRCASTDATRFQLNRVQIKREDDRHELCATNGKLVALARWTDAESNGGFSRMAISAGTCKELLKVRAPREKIAAELAPDSETAEEYGKERTFVLKPADGIEMRETDPSHAFPDYSYLLGKYVDDRTEIATVNLNPYYLLEACETIIRMAGWRKSDCPMVTLSLRREQRNPDAPDSREVDVPVRMVASGGDHESAVYLMPMIRE